MACQENTFAQNGVTAKRDTYCDSPLVAGASDRVPPRPRQKRFFQPCRTLAMMPAAAAVDTICRPPSIHLRGGTGRATTKTDGRAS